MSVKSLLETALQHIMQINNGMLTANNVTIKVYKNFVKTRERSMQIAGYDEMDDMQIIGTPSDVASLKLIPGKTRCTLDGVAYIVGKTITESPGYTSVWLRLQ